ncbi:endospore germination permease [Ammoniphilus sp. CFH 90114]|uniref:GerAB/ArcD/ProY family transporter n=1 Tax=Ammoniphilus sp. CFH 90114 TaxID=2493665 RepID=UPI00100DE0C9|nr:endospore germination permease [Ammoniphilus sp. CFH 90114]RXT04872.1 spore gernimation protein [Ammoniphilus sp. CFH 90114]
MKSFEYGDEEVSNKEIMISVTAMIIGAGILTLPRGIAKVTMGLDGWLSIILGGGIAMLFAWVCAKLASRFPRKAFLEYATLLVTRPGAIILTLLFGFHFLFFTAYEMRVVANISKIYLFDQTPVEALGLVFLLVVVYAVSGSRVGILRINLMFMPIVLFIATAVVLMNLNFFEFDNLRPFFTSDWKGYLEATRETSFTFLGFEVLLFYVALSNQPQKAPKAAILGVSIPILLYLVVYFIVIGVFGPQSTAQMVYPTIELAKEVEVPGQFFERFESIFFTIWIMALFSTSAMALDITVMCLKFIWPKVKKVTFVFILSPVIYMIGMFPENQISVTNLGNFISYSGIGLAVFIPTLLLILAKVRGVKGHA